MQTEPLVCWREKQERVCALPRTFTTALMRMDRCDKERTLISYAVRHSGDTDYRYRAWRRGGKVFVRGPVSVLVLASDAAVRAFLRLVDRLGRMDKVNLEGLVDELRAFEELYR
jgi:hypothetical protein